MEPMLSVRGTFTCKTMLEEQLLPNFTEPNVVGSDMLPGRGRERERGGRPEEGLAGKLNEAPMGILLMLPMSKGFYHCG